MSRVTKVLIAVGAIFGLAIAAVLTVGVLGGGTLRNIARSSDIPPCESLQPMAEVTAALRQNASLVAEYEKIGPEVKVTFISPCDDKNLAMAQITYANSAQKTAITNLIAKGPALGASIHLERVR